MMEKTQRTSVELTPSTIARLKRLGGTLKNTIELLSFTDDTTKLIQRREAFLNPSSAAPVPPKPAATPKPTGRPRTRQPSTDEQQDEKARELMSYGYSREVAENMNNDNIARCEAEIKAGKSPKQLQEAAAAWSDE